MKKFSLKIILTFVLIVTTVLSVSACGAEPATDNSEKTTAAPTAESPKTSDGKARALSEMQVVGDTVYCIGNGEKSALLKLDINNASKSTTVFENDTDQIIGIVESEGKIYYATLANIYRIDTDGKNAEKLCDDIDGCGTVKFILLDDKIYYSDGSGNIKYITADGKSSKILYTNEKCAKEGTGLDIFDIFDGCIYFATGDEIGKVGLDGSNAKIIYKDEKFSVPGSNPSISGDYIYYTDIEDGKYDEEFDTFLCRVKLDGTEDKKYTNTKNTFDYSVEGDKIYYVREGSLYSMATDGSNETKIADIDTQNSYFKFIYNNHIYFSSESADPDNPKFELWYVDENGKGKETVASYEVKGNAEVLQQDGYAVIGYNNGESYLVKLK